MTAREVIEALKDCDPNAEVLVLNVHYDNMQNSFIPHTCELFQTNEYFKPNSLYDGSSVFYFEIGNKNLCQIYSSK